MSKIQRKNVSTIGLLGLRVAEKALVTVNIVEQKKLSQILMRVLCGKKQALCVMTYDRQNASHVHQKFFYRMNHNIHPALMLRPNA